MYLFDTNVWIERLLGQDHSGDVGLFLDRISLDEIFLTDFSFHSICLILLRHKRPDALIDFIDDIFSAGVTLLSCPPDEIGLVVDLMNKYELDFDDAYQYFIAEENKLVIVSFDSDFDRTPVGRMTPAKVLALPELISSQDKTREFPS